MSHKLLRMLCTSAFAMMILVISAFAADYSVVEVTSEKLNFRTEPNTKSAISTVLNEGNLLLVETPAEDAEWVKVISSDYGEGYVSNEYVKTFALEDNKDVMGLGRVTVSSLNVRSAPSTDATRIGSVSMSSRLQLLNYEDGWYKIAYSSDIGYVSAEYIQLAGQTVASGLGQQIVDYALGFVGQRYVYGGAKPGGFDCSGLTMYVYEQFGYSLSHGATAQYSTGTRISKSDLQPGDLVFFYPLANGRIGHVGIYIGDNQFVHASNQTYGVRIDLLEGGYYTGQYVGATRII